MTITTAQTLDNQENRTILATSVLAWIRLMRIYHKIDRRTADLMKEWKLSVSRFDVLNHAGNGEGKTQQQLADALMVTKGNICQVLDGMEAEGLLYRRRSGRTNHIYLTDEGRSLRSTLVPTQEAEIDRAFSALTADEQQTLLTLLRKLDRSLTADTAPRG
jgi:MarR family 2-MHQ and catechol resistance regulon transcriptional repressor